MVIIITFLEIIALKCSGAYRRTEVELGKKFVSVLGAEHSTKVSEFFKVFGVGKSKVSGYARANLVGMAVAE